MASGSEKFVFDSRAFLAEGQPKISAAAVRDKMVDIVCLASIQGRL